VTGGKVLSFGELLLRLCPDTSGEWLQENSLSFYVGGAEANVATALATWGIPSAYLTVIPDNLMTRQLTGYLEQRQIDTSRIRYQGDRLGLYFLPKGKDLKNAGVIYDRDHSSFSALQPGSIDWEQVLEGISWFHFSAISPALNNRVALVCEEAVKAASARNITISVDLNYRAKLWQYGVDPVAVMPGLVQYCDVIMGNLWAAGKMLGVPVDTAIIGHSEKEDYLRHAQLTSERIAALYPRAAAGVIANTFRFDRVVDGRDVRGVDGASDPGASGIHYYTALYADKQFYHSAEYFADKIADKVGSGDCYMAGLIYGLYKGHSLQQTLEFATAAAFKKLFITSDATDQKAGDIEQFIKTYER
jgi:2-dehydro-3-deoxygluconokinase